MLERRQQIPLEDRLSAWAKAVHIQAAQLPPGPEREAMTKKARQADVAVQLNGWITSPGLQPPK